MFISTIQFTYLDCSLCRGAWRYPPPPPCRRGARSWSWAPPPWSRSHLTLGGIRKKFPQQGRNECSMNAMNSWELQTFALYWYANSLLTFSLKCIAEFHFMKENSLIHKSFGINLINIPLISSNSIRVQSGILVLSKILFYKQRKFSLRVLVKHHKNVIIHKFNCLVFDTGDKKYQSKFLSFVIKGLGSIASWWSVQDKSHLSKTNCQVTFDSRKNNFHSKMLPLDPKRKCNCSFPSRKNLLAWIWKVVNNCPTNLLTAAWAKISSILWKV